MLSASRRCKWVSGKVFDLVIAGETSRVFKRVATGGCPGRRGGKLCVNSRVPAYRNWYGAAHIWL